MPGYFSLHVVHASVAKFDGIEIANFMKSVGLWEGLLNYSQKLFSNICFYIFAEGGVKPSDFSVSNFYSGRFVSGIGVKILILILILIVYK